MILPSGYKRLLYIESTGTQYVDCGISVPHATARTVVDFEVTTTGATQVVTGHMDGAFSWATNFLYLYKDNRFAVNNYVPTDFTASVGSRFLIDYTNKSLEINGKSYPVTQRSYTDGYNDAIFYSTDFPGKFKLYSYKLYDGETIVRNYIPAESPDGVIGLYDTVNGTFNAGVGVFIAGPEWWYDELEYIESSGTQYIDTGFKPNNNTRVLMDFQAETSAGWIFGSYSSGYFAGLLNSETSITYYYGSENKTLSIDSITNRRILDANKNVLTYGDNSVTATAGTFSNAYTAYLFASNVNGNVSSGKVAAKLYSCQIYDNGTLVRDFIPAKLSDDSIGLIDKLTEEFYPNMGTGTFLAGNVKPSRYIELEYIESSGTQYVDTGWKPNQDTRVVMDVDILNTANSSYGIFGARTGGSTDLFVLWNYTNAMFRSSYGTDNKDYNVNSTSRRRVFDKNKNTFSVDGVVIANHPVQSFQTTCSLTMLAINSGGAVDSRMISGKLYSCQIYDNGTLFRDYIPIKLTDGTVGLLDKVSGLFYGNAGTGVFVAGPAIATEYTKLEYVESTGEQYIDTQFIPVSGATAELTFEATVVDASVESWVAGVFDLSVSGYPRMRAGLVSGAYYTADTNGFTYNGAPGEYTVATGGVSKAGCTLSLYLFAQHEAANGAAHMANSKYRLYGAKFFVSGVLDMDLIPAIANGVPGMVDQLNNRFYPSNTAVMLVAGPEIADIEPTVTPEEFIAPYVDFANILLMWKTVPYAEGYNLYRDGELIATTAVPVFFDGGLELQTEYTYAVTAFNELGESEPAEITASTTEFKLVTDRTAADVQAVLAGNLDSLAWYAGMKGAYNATDLNRVEAAVLFVIERLRIAGWYLEAQTKHWTFADFPTASEMQRYLDNVRLLRSALPVGLPMVPSDMNLFRYDEANTIESILERLDAAVTNIMQNVYYSSEIYSGEVR